MAFREIKQYYDDFDQRPLSEEEVHSIHFAVNKKRYVIDLAPENAQRFHDALSPFIEAGRPDDVLLPTRPRRKSASEIAADRSFNRKAREWLRASGEKVAPRGKIPANLLAKYRAHLEGRL